ncbi:MAG: cation transporter [Thermoleophilaceae bacterium]|nr:cation transporter [Thermoleophilaceae bacterium]MBA3839797.1 cation transporter [Thermoleophilaceae bacterium]
MHAPDRTANGRALGVVLVLVAAFAVVEVVGGLFTGSLALLADAGHMLSDAMALGLALLALALARRPATPKRSFGLQRAEILAALANGVTLVAIALWIFIEAFGRLAEPSPILAGPMLAVAFAGLVVNAVGAAVLARGGDRSLNVSAALRHVMADMLGSVGAIAAAIIVLTTGWGYADPLVSVLIGLLVLASSYGILRDSLRVLLEAAPAGIDPSEVGRRMVEADGVVEVHDLHVWTITSGFPALAAHVLVGRGEDCHARRRELETLLRHEFDLEHTTLQVDHAPDRALLEIETADGHGPRSNGR